MGELCPQQEKALEALGFDLPTGEKVSRHNNRKMVFDATCRALLFEICKRHGLHLDEEPEYGGRKHLEKQDFIIAKQKEQMAVQSETIFSQQTAIAVQSDRIQKCLNNLWMRNYLPYKNGKYKIESEPRLWYYRDIIAWLFSMTVG